jgi:type IX secretion system PorP/SprF family membrane protein
MNGAYKFNINDDFQVEPSFMLKYVSPAPLKFDIGVRAIYKETVWLGGAFRTKDAWSALVGFMYKKNLLIGYSYDFTTTNLKHYSTGTHELVLGVKFTGNSVAKGDFDPSMY